MKINSNETPSNREGGECGKLVALSQSHIQFGWWSLLAFLATGIILEALHGFKVPWYLNVGNETRRLMFTLGHAHGTLFAIVNIALGCSCTLLAPRLKYSHFTAASFLLKISTLAMPIGFILGGVQIYAGDPGVGIVLVPVAAILLLVAIAKIALAFSKLSTINK